MSTKTELILNLGDALQSFDWISARSICGSIVAGIREGRFELTKTEAKNTLSQLRRKRRFRLISGLAEALLWSETASNTVRRHYTQALVDEGFLSPALLMVNTILNATGQLDRIDVIEAKGLLGRIYKQALVDEGCDRKEIAQKNFDLAFDAYNEVYSSDPLENHWHGINCVALLKKAERDGLSTEGRQDAKELAENIIAGLEELEQKAETPNCWEIATYLEALIALDRYEEAEQKALDYLTCPGADAFEINSTLRQLRDVWQLGTQSGAARRIMSLLNATLLKREGGEVRLNHEEYISEIQNITRAEANLEAYFGDDRTKTIEWYRNGLVSCESVARIETLDGRGFATGWLVDPSDLGIKEDGPLLITNSHAISNHGPDQGLPPDQARANFQLEGRKVKFGKIVWSRPQDNDLDTTILALAETVNAKPLPLMSSPLKKTDPLPRVYIIGHPGGRDMEFSVHDNRIVDFNDQKLHYRSPTEKGSSGSPVFDEKGWQVVALHHAGRANMPRLDGNGTYEANEGISILEIRRAYKEDTSG